MYLPKSKFQAIKLLTKIKKKNSLVRHTTSNHQQDIDDMFKRLQVILNKKSDKHYIEPTLHIRHLLKYRIIKKNRLANTTK